MTNELLLIASVFVIYGMVILGYKLFGKNGLFAFTVFANIAANIEVLIMINAFGMEQTLGNVLFASSFLITDILSEMHGKKEAEKAVHIGIFASICFVIISQSWLIYNPAESDWAQPAFKTIFSNTPRLILASVLVYAISQMFDVWMYHKWWEFTNKKFGDKRKWLWLRNNGSTLISQFLNTVLYTFGAFLGMYDLKTLISICLSSYVIFVFTSLLDTPFVYLARYINDKRIEKEGSEDKNS